MKNQTLTFRVDDSTKLQLKESAQSLDLSESEFIRRAIREFESLLVQAKQVNHKEERIKQLETTLLQLKRQLETYEKDSEINKLFSTCKGHTINGK